MHLVLKEPCFHRHVRQTHENNTLLEGKKFLCGIVKESRKLLNSHEKTHQTGSFSCEFCNYKTHLQQNLKYHLRYMHADRLGVEQQYHQCEQCGKQFKNKGNLIQHMEYSHSNKGPDPKYKCHICNKQLKQDNSYRKHMANSHGVGEKCEICNKLYVTKPVLLRHMQKVHDIHE